MKMVGWAGAQALALMACGTFGFAAEAAGVAGAASASPDQFVQVEPVYDPQKTYGSAQTSYTVRIEEFLPPNSGVLYSTQVATGIYVFQSAGPQIDWWAGIHIPNGALIDRVELQACDTTATGSIVFGMARMDAPAGNAANVTPIGNTGTAATPGCAFFSVTPTGTLAIDNRNNSYILFVDWAGDFTVANKVAAVRVFYHLQVSPAPGVATFPNDVPTSHPFFRFVEALAAAGISGGCGAGSFCPDSAVTRGQMAVFLASALGLHFPN
jgi:hypothetical protein